MNMFWVCLLLTVDAIFARPTIDVSEVKYQAARYAARHPNKEIGHQEECEILGVGETDEANPLNVINDESKKWSFNTVYYEIVRGGYTLEQISLIEAGIADLQELTKVNGEQCIFIHQRGHEANYVNVENYSGCSSYVGMIGGKQRISLVDGCVTRHGTIMHEFMHALGFYHEHQRYDRDDHVTINWDNIQSGTENNFIKKTESNSDLLGTPYDYGSVMHYSGYGFAIDPTEPTIIPDDPDAEIGQRVTLSAWDIERIQIFYGCLAAKDSVYFKHLA